MTLFAVPSEAVTVPLKQNMKYYSDLCMYLRIATLQWLTKPTLSPYSYSTSSFGTHERESGFLYRTIFLGGEVGLHE